MMFLVGPDASLCRGAPTSLLAELTLAFLLGGRRRGSLERLDSVQQLDSSELPIATLIPGLLALHRDPGGSMDQHHTGGDLVDVLSPVPPGAHKRLVQVLFPDPQALHPGQDRIGRQGWGNRRVHGGDCFTPNPGWPNKVRGVVMGIDQDPATVRQRQKAERSLDQLASCVRGIASMGLRLPN